VESKYFPASESLDSIKYDELVKHIDVLGDRLLANNFDLIVANATIEDAKYFTKYLYENNLIFPYVSLASDGEINFYWNSEHITIDLGFFGNETYSYFAFTKEKEFIEDGISIVNPLPENILQFIKNK
jgi:hypothetical protein